LFWAQSVKGVLDSIKDFASKTNKKDLKYVSSLDCSEDIKKSVYAAHGLKNSVECATPHIFSSFNSALKLVLETFGVERGRLILGMLNRAIVVGATSSASISTHSPESRGKTSFGRLLGALKRRFENLDDMCTLRLEDVDMTANAHGPTIVAKSTDGSHITQRSLQKEFTVGARDYIEKNWADISRRLGTTTDFKSMPKADIKDLISDLQSTKQAAANITLGQVWSMLHSKPTSLHAHTPVRLYETEIAKILNGIKHPRFGWKNNIKTYSEKMFTLTIREFFLKEDSADMAKRQTAWMNNAVVDAEDTLKAGMLAFTHWVTGISHNDTKSKAFIPAVAAIVESIFTIGRFSKLEDKDFVDEITTNDKLSQLNKTAKRLTKAICQLLCNGTALAFNPMFMLNQAERIADHLYINTSEIQVRCLTMTPEIETEKQTSLFAHKISVDVNSKYPGDGEDETISMPPPILHTEDHFQYLDNGGWIGYALNPVTHYQDPVDASGHKPRNIPVVWHGGRPAQPRKAEMIDRHDNPVHTLLPETRKLVHKTTHCCRNKQTLAFAMAATLSYHQYCDTIPRTPCTVRTVVTRGKEGKADKTTMEDVAHHFAPRAQHAHVNASANALSRVFATAVMMLTPDA